MKKLITVVMALIMVLTVGALVGCNDDKKSGSGTKVTGTIKYELQDRKQEDGGDYYIVTKMEVSDADSKKINDDDYEDIKIDLVIPSTYEGLPVEEIKSEAFKDQKLIKSATIPSSVKEIGAGAFAGCVNLEKITLPFIGESEVAVNEKRVFGYIFGTETADGLEETKQRYTGNTETTKSYYIPTALQEVVFNGVERTVKEEVGGVESDVVKKYYNLPEYAFSACKNIKTITLNANTTAIPRSAFMDCTGLARFTFTSNIQTIGVEAFKGCTELRIIKFELKDGDSGKEGLTRIEENAFEGCSNLFSEVNLVLPETLEYLGERAFKSCTALKGIDLSKVASGFEIKAHTFDSCTALENAIFNNGQIIRSDAFSNCTSLKASGVVNVENCTKETNAFSYEEFNI